jgi:ATP-dependent DNA helicase RecG
MRVMTDQELETLFNDLESHRAERKASVKTTGDKIRRTICAFANDIHGRGETGVLFIGVHDDGSCAGLSIDDDLLCKLANIHDEGDILPLPSFTVEKRNLQGCDIAVIAVQPSIAPPVRHKGTVYVRVGPSTRAASVADEVALCERRRSSDLPFDLRPIPSATLQDLDIRYFEENYLPKAFAQDVLEENNRSLEEKLTSLRFLTAEAPCVPTALGALNLAKEPEYFLPCAYIQFLRIEGTEVTGPIKAEHRISGPLAQVMAELDQLLKIHISEAVDFTAQSTEQRQPDYPLVALQQLSRNAVLHRAYEATNAPIRIHWFSDRIEIQSPGGPFGGVNQENFGRPGITDYRNPNLAESLRVLGYVQRFGMGIQQAQTTLKQNGNPPAEFVVDQSNVLAILRRAT